MTFNFFLFCFIGDSSQWMVPISISTEKKPSETVKEVLLDCKSTQVVLEGISADTWVKLNPGTVGYYR